MSQSTDLSALLQEGVVNFSRPIDWIRGAASLFARANLYYGHGTDNAWDEACFLVREVLNIDPLAFDRVLNCELWSDERALLANYIAERIQTRKPMPYILNKAYFGGLPFYVDERVLIPRSPFAEWIEKQFEPFLNVEPQQILELCTGSGCMAVLLAECFPDSQIQAVDLSPDALAVAERNISDYGLSDRIELIESDLFSALSPDEDGPYQLIVANPPYVSSIEYAELPMEFLHEPRMALEAGETGLDLVARILMGASDYLTPEGLLVIEMGQSRDLFLQMFPQLSALELECEKGGDGLFCFHAADLAAFPKR